MFNAVYSNGNGEILEMNIWCGTWEEAAKAAEAEATDDWELIEITRVAY